MTCLTHNALDILVLCVALGVGYSLLCWIAVRILLLALGVVPISILVVDLAGGLVFCTFSGGLMGTFWSLFAVPMLRQRSIKVAALALGSVMASIAILGAFLGLFWSQWHPAATEYGLVIGPTSVLLVVCLILRLALPFTLPLRPKCALQAETGVCLTCGDTTLYMRHCYWVRLLAILGLCASAGIAVLHAYTYSQSCRAYANERVFVGIDRGCLLFELHPEDWRTRSWSSSYHLHLSIDGYVYWPLSAGTTTYIPLWMIFLPLICASVITWRRAGRPPPGFCRKCGYNLRGLASGRCPECGCRFLAS